MNAFPILFLDLSNIFINCSVVLLEVQIHPYFTKKGVVKNVSLDERKLLFID